MSQRLGECTVTAALSCRIQKWLEVTCRLLLCSHMLNLMGYLCGLFSFLFTPNFRYSMVLIGAAFFHCRYLQLFQDQPQAVHALVDETQNCDDIAVNFAVALYLRKHSTVNRPAGIFIKPVDLRNLEKDASSGYQGMWHRPEHLLQRSYCLNRLTQIYGFMPLRYSNLMVSQFGFPSYANHKIRG